MAADPPPSAPGPTRSRAPSGMQELGAVLGAGTWWCDQVFVVAGGWVPSTPEAPVRAHLAELSRVVGEHAVALRRHLPRPTGVDPETWVAPPTPATPGVVEALVEPTGSIERLAGIHRVVAPRLLVAWGVHIRGADLSDRGVARTLRHARADLFELWDEGEGHLQALIGGEAGSVRRAGVAATAIEEALVSAGGLGALIPPPALP